MTSAHRPPPWGLGSVAALVVLWLAATAGARPLMLPDEGRYVGVAWEMLRSGDWLTPTLNGLPYFHKPPLFYWITAGAMALFGANAWAARMAPLLGACLGACALYAFTRRWGGTRAAMATLAVLLVQPLYYLGGQFANLDMLVAGCISATVLLLAHAALSAQQGLPHRAARDGAYAMAALGVLAKGLIGAVLPALVIVAWLLLRRRQADLRALLSWRGAGLFVLLASPWFIAMQWRFSGFLDYFFVVQQFKRYATAGYNNAQPFWFYPAILLLVSLPWLPWLRPAWLRHRAPDPQRDAVRLLMLVWLVVVVAFFSLPRSKLLGYVLPAVPPWAWLVADSFLADAAPSAQRLRRWWASLGIAVALGLGAVAWLTLRPPDSSSELAHTLALRHAPGEPVLMLNGYSFDLPFYARLRQPVPVVDDWASPEVQRRDNWRKELADAGQFAEADARRLLLPTDALPAWLCLSPVSWVIGPAVAAGRFAFLQPDQVAAAGHGNTLWRVAIASPAVASALGCAGTPNADSPGK